MARCPTCRFWRDFQRQEIRRQDAGGEGAGGEMSGGKMGGYLLASLAQCVVLTTLLRNIIVI